MKRDFSESTKNELLGYVKEVEDEKWFSFTDWLGDRWYDFEEFIGSLRIDNYIDNIDEYHKKVIDKNNTSASDINKIFDDVNDVDKDYKKKINKNNEDLNNILNYVISIKNTISPINGDFSASNVNELLSTLKDGLPDINKSKDELIKEFEELHPEIKEKLDEILSVYPEDKIRDVKYLIYSAEEPFRSVYLDNLNEFDYVDFHSGDGQYFSPNNNTIHLDIDANANDPRGPWCTFFHESGHAIDDVEKIFGDFANEYTNDKGESFQKIIFDDVENSLDKSMDKYKDKFTKDEMNNVKDFIIGPDVNIDSSGLTEHEKELVNLLSNEYSVILSGSDANGVSDVYGGVTNNVIVGEYGHDFDHTDNYWYDTSGNDTSHINSELWAHYFSAYMTGDYAKIENLRIYFPEACKAMDEMIEEMRNN